MEGWDNKPGIQDPTRSRLHDTKQAIKESEQSQVDSTKRAMAAIAESEQIGIATNQELHRQGEQLDNIDKKLDEINEDLKVTQKQIKSIKGPCGRFKDWWNGLRGNKTPPTSSETAVTSSSTEGKSDQVSSNKDTGKGFFDDDNDEHAGSDGQKQYFKPVTKSDQEQQINENLNIMSDGMSRLKVIAGDMGNELDRHNKVLDKITDKTDNTQLTIEDQNKQIRKMLN